jgi:hypothetical protein
MNILLGGVNLECVQADFLEPPSPPCHIAGVW